MLYVKLILRNLRRSLKEYILFMATMIMSMTLMYAFFSLALSDRTLSIFQSFTNFLPISIVASIGVTIVLGWMIVYISDFIMRKRSREFGLYLLSGMKRSSVALMFTGEQFIMGLLSFVIGCCLGMLLSQAMEAILMQLFSLDYHFILSFSMDACLLTLLCFIIIYILEAIRKVMVIHRCSLKELFYRKDEHTVIRASKTRSVLCFVAGAVCMGICMVIVYIFYRSVKDQSVRGDIHALVLGIVMMILSIYLIYQGISQVVVMTLEKYKQKKYKGNMMFLSAQLCTKMKRNRFVLATISVLTILIISFIMMSMQLKHIYDFKVKEDVPFDVMAYTSKTIHDQDIYGYLKEHHMTYEDHAYQIYHSDAVDENLKEALTDTPFGYPGITTYVMKESDVQALRKLKGYAPMPKLKDNEYGLIMTPELKPHMEAFMQKANVNINHQELSCAYMEDSRIGQAVYVDYYLILPDAYVENFEVKSNVLVMNVNEMIPDDFYEKTVKHLFDIDHDGFYLYRIKPYYIKDQLSVYTMVIFSLLYVSMIAICIMATMIATQQLSDIQEQKDAYRMMSHMGTDRQTLKKLLFQQVCLYFMIPMILPCIYLPFVTYGMHAFMSLVFVELPIISPVSVAIIIFLLIYGCYFILTYHSCKRSMEGW